MHLRHRRLVVLAMAAAAVTAEPAAPFQENTVLLSGAVTMSDNAPPPNAVLVRRICRSQVQDETWTDPRGHYNFKVDGRQGASAAADATQATRTPAELDKPLGNASQYSNPITTALRDCEVTAVLAGYRSEPVSLTVHTTMDDMRIPTIILFPISQAEALTVSATTAAAPRSAVKAREKAQEAMKAQDWTTAQRELNKAVKAYPKFAVAWFELGLAFEKQGEMPNAVEAWQQAAKADSKYLPPYERLAAWADHNQQWQAALSYSSAWIRLDSDDFPAAYLVNAIAAARLNRADEAERAARAGLLIDKNRRIPRLNYVLGLILAEKHRYAEAIEQLQEYLKYAPDAKDAETVRQQIAKLQQTASGARQ